MPLDAQDEPLNAAPPLPAAPDAIIGVPADNASASQRDIIQPALDPNSGTDSDNGQDTVHSSLPSRRSQRRRQPPAWMKSGTWDIEGT